MKLVSVLAILLITLASLGLAVDQKAAPPTPPAEEGAVAQEKSVEVVPTLTEWGMIIFGVLLAGWMGWMVKRRRNKVTAGF
jgi:hypothetical protein